MSLMSYNQLLRILDVGVLTHSAVDLVNPASIDIRLGNKILIEKCEMRIEDGKQVPTLKRVSLKNKTPLDMTEYDLEKQGPFILYPGEFILAHSFEVFNLPNNISAEYSLKSSMARIGLEHLNAGWADAGWNGSVLTLEFKNMTRGHEIELNFMDKIGQVKFFTHAEVPQDKSYAVRGRYNNNMSVSGVQPSLARGIVFGEDAEEEEAELYARTHESPVEDLEALAQEKKSSLIITD